MTSRSGISFVVWVYVLLGLGIPAVGFAATLYVNGGCGDDSWSGLSDACAAPDGPKATIQAAIDAAVNGDTVQVAQGVYVENINFQFQQDIVLTSGNPDKWDVVRATVIQGDGTDSVVKITGIRNRLEGFTIIGGIGEFSDLTNINTYKGGGVLANSQSTIRRNIITGNLCPYQLNGSSFDLMSYGGGIFSYSSNTIEENIIYDNMSAYGSGIYIQGGQCTIKNNLIYGNYGVRGGGLYIHGDILILLLNNTITYNSAIWDGGNVYLYFYGDGSVIANNIISYCLEESGLSVNPYSTGSFTFAYNNVFGNFQSDYENMMDQTGINGNISENPLFADSGARDFHLLSGSPCVNAGDPGYTPDPGESDIDGETRVYDEQIDIGADELVALMANAGADQFLDAIGMVTLDGSDSGWPDPDGTKQYQWTQISGPSVVLSDPCICAPTFMPPTLDEYVFELVISDGVDTSEPDEVLIAVGNRSPVAVAVDRAFLPDEPALLDGSASYDPDADDVLTWQWQQVAGEPVTLHDADKATAWFEGAAEGDYRFELTVSDGDLSDSCQVDITCMGVQVYDQPLEVSIDNYRFFHFPDISDRWSVFCAGVDYDYSWEIWAKEIGGDTLYTVDAGPASIHPRVDGDLLVWASSGNSVGDPWYHEPMNSSVKIRNLSTGQQATLRQWSMSNSYSYPAVSAAKVVWVEHLGLDPNPPGPDAGNWYNTPYNICGADVSDINSPVYFTIAENVGRRDPYPCYTYYTDVEDVLDISGDIVVWEGDGDIYGADISDLNSIVVFTICDAPGRQCDPAISGNLVVWTDQRYDEGDIYGADISDLDHIQEFGIVREPGCQQQPAIDGDVIVFVDGSFSIGGSYTGEIKLCHLIGPEHRPIVLSFDTPHYGTAPSINGDKIVWQTPHEDFYETKIEGATYNVIILDSDGPVENITKGYRYGSIQDALLGGGSGDEIVAAAGMYHENIQFMGRDVFLRSSDPDDPSGTVISGDGTGPVVTFDGSEGQECQLRGFTVTGGVNNGSNQRGGGICGNKTLATIRQCVIEGNQAYHCGGIADCEGLVEQCVIRNNTAIGWSGGIAGLLGTVKNCIINDNYAGTNGGVYTWKGDILQCTILNNTATTLGGGIYNSAGVLSHCIVWGNTPDQVYPVGTATYCCVEGDVMAGVGNINVDPCFVDATGGDFHLSSEGWRWDVVRQVWTWDDRTSRCIDAGNPGCELADEYLAVPDDPDNIFGVNLRINMGAYGGTAQASMPPHHWALLGDLDNDGMVNLVDFYRQGTDWLTTDEEQPGDLNRDGVVDTVDVGLLCDEWLEQTLWY